MTTQATSLDETDRTIIALLQDNARMTNAAIGVKVGLTAPSVFERIRKLEQRAVIRGYSAIINANALGKVMTAFLRLTVADDDKYDSGVEALRDDPDVLECHHVAGEDCFIVKTKVAGPAELEALLGRVRAKMTIQRSVTMIALSTIKEYAPVSAEP